MAVALGADAIGFVFAPSSRQITVSAARDIVKRLPASTMTIGVFRDHSADEVIETVLEAGLTGAQLHGHETPAMAREVRPKAKVLIAAFASGSPGIERFDQYGADALLLDGVTPGSGKVFDWSLVDGVPAKRRLILAGGLGPDNVANAIATVEPWGVDVSSGVELSPGQKDPRKVQAFIREARNASAALDINQDGPPTRTNELFDWYEDDDV